MLGSCAICATKLVTVSDDITATPCGHIFHYSCLLEWIQRSRSCPQCRQKTTEKNLVKLFFDNNPGDQSEIDKAQLVNANDNLKFQITLKDQELNVCKEGIVKLKKEKKGLSDEVDRLKSDNSVKKETIRILQSQLDYNKSALDEARVLKSKYESLQSKLHSYEFVRSAIEDKSQDIEAIIEGNSGLNLETNLRDLATLNVMLKRSMMSLSDEKRRYRSQLESLQVTNRKIQKDNKVSTEKLKELCIKVKNLESDVQSLENENKGLSKKISTLQESIISPSGNVKNSVINRLLSENITPAGLKELKNSDLNVSEICLTPEIIRSKKENTSQNDNSASSTIGKSRSMPYLQLKSSGVNPFTKKPKISTPDLRFPNKKPIISSSSEDFGYDGLGGHHVADFFPKPCEYQNKKKRKIKVVNNSRNISTKLCSESIKDFFKNTFDD